MGIQTMSIIACVTVKHQPLVSNFQVNLNNMDNFFRRHNDTVLFVVGATGTGKSRLAVDLAARFPAEIINSDKIQLYDGLDIASNKISEEETRGVTHHLMGILPDPDSPFSAADFSRRAAASVDSVLSRRLLPIVAGGSNSHIDSLAAFLRHRPHRRHQFCFLWVDVEFQVLREFVSERVDRMVAAGLVEEVREIFDPAADYSRGLRRAIGAPELDGLFRAELRGAGAATRAGLLAEAVARIKDNTCRLASRQLKKIERLRAKWGTTSWSRENFRRLDATEAFAKRRQGPDAADEAWARLVAGPGMSFVEDFLYGDGLARSPPSVILPAPALPIAAAAVAR